MDFAISIKILKHITNFYGAVNFSVDVRSKINHIYNNKAYILVLYAHYNIGKCLSKITTLFCFLVSIRSK